MDEIRHRATNHFMINRFILQKLTPIRQLQSIMILP